MNQFYRRSALVSLLALAVYALPSSASVIFDSQGFEAPAYTLGNLEGQNGWQQSSDPGTSTAVVESPIANGGTQAVQLDRAADSNIRWGVTTTGFPTTPTDTIRIDFDMLVRGS